MRCFFAASVFAVCLALPCHGQQGEAPLRIFGYFQNAFTYQNSSRGEVTTSFTAQQLNLFLQKDLAEDFTALVNFEVINGYSSREGWGTWSLQEAWVRYRWNRRLSLKLGLHIPTFNRLNDINNRTPLLPYVIRPLVYETSFDEFLANDEYTPSRGFLSAYGYLPIGQMKLDYSVFTGNSPNIRRVGDPFPNVESQGQSGVDSTRAMQLGGRIALRTTEATFGLSATHERTNQFVGAERFYGGTFEEYELATRYRLGADLYLEYDKLTLEGEVIWVRYPNKPIPQEANLTFAYATVGYNIVDRLFVYGSFSQNAETLVQITPRDVFSAPLEISVGSVGATYTVTDRVVFKAQYAHADLDFGATQFSGATPPIDISDTFTDFVTLAISVVF
ncbi:MAG: hypothetical protein RhofKO_24750 [Rhodothermales bacterium]